MDNEGMAAEQAHHSRRTAQLIYGRLETAMSNITYNWQEALMSFSDRWHKYIGLADDYRIGLYRSLDDLPLAITTTPHHNKRTIVRELMIVLLTVLVDQAYRSLI